MNAWTTQRAPPVSPKASHDHLHPSDLLHHGLRDQPPDRAFARGLTCRAPPAYPFMSPATRQRLAEQFAAFALSAQQRAERARLNGDAAGWARHTNNAVRLAIKAEMLGG